MTTELTVREAVCSGGETTAALEIAGHVDVSHGPVEHAGDVMIGGNIADGLKVAGRSIRVGGVIEAAEVLAAVDLCAEGGIAGRGKGRCRSGGGLTAKYLTSAVVEAAGDVNVQLEVVTSRVVCTGRLIVEQGQVVGGHVTAMAGVTCRAAGSPANVPTIIEVAVDERLRRLCTERLPQIDQQRRKARQVRQVVEPLLRNQKSLTAQQKEKATELLYDAADLEGRADRDLQQLKAMRDAMEAQASAEIVVAETIHPGVVLRFPGLESRVESSLKGPLRILRRRAGGLWQIVLVCPSGYVLPLQAHALVDKPMEELARALGARG